MTIQHDLSLNPDARIQRRLSNLEQGYIANQQTGAWVKTIVLGETANATEVGATINGAAFVIPVSGQYIFTTSLDISNGSTGLAVVQLSVEGSATIQNVISANLRIPASPGWGGYVEKGKLISAKFNRFSGAGTVTVIAGGTLVIHKIA